MSKEPREVANPVTNSAQTPSQPISELVPGTTIPLTPREIEFSKQISKLRQERSEMEGDFRTVVKIFADIMKELGIDPKMFSDTDVSANLPAIIGKLTMKMSANMIDFEAFAQVSAAGPIIEKYKPLVEDLLP